MNFFEPGSTTVTLVTLMAVTVAAIAIRSLLRVRRRARQRIVEQPNSHYSSLLVRNGETRHRWHSIELDRIHEVNRGEVKRLLNKVSAAGVDSLRDSERVFLDQFADLSAPRTSPQQKPAEARVAPDLHHRPA